MCIDHRVYVVSTSCLHVVYTVCIMSIHCLHTQHVNTLCSWLQCVYTHCTSHPSDYAICSGHHCLSWGLVAVCYMGRRWFGHWLWLQRFWSSISAVYLFTNYTLYVWWHAMWICSWCDVQYVDLITRIGIAQKQLMFAYNSHLLHASEQFPVWLDHSSDAYTSTRSALPFFVLLLARGTACNFVIDLCLVYK